MWYKYIFLTRTLTHQVSKNLDYLCDKRAFLPAYNLTFAQISCVLRRIIGLHDRTGSQCSMGVVKLCWVVNRYKPFSQILVPAYYSTTCLYPKQNYLRINFIYLHVHYSLNLLKKSFKALINAWFWMQASNLQVILLNGKWFLWKFY